MPGKKVLYPAGLFPNVLRRVVIPNGCEGSKKDFSLCSKQGFLPAVEMTEWPAEKMLSALRHSLPKERERVSLHRSTSEKFVGLKVIRSQFACGIHV
jgi:hypothetical protein